VTLRRPTSPEAIRSHPDPVRASLPGDPPMKSPDEPVHWLVRPRSIRWIWIIFVAVLLASLAGDLLVHHHVTFGLDASFGFHAWFGFATCIAMILVAKALGLFLKRPDSYYEGEDEP
jgi:hypothetical protein